MVSTADRKSTVLQNLSIHSTRSSCKKLFATICNYTFFLFVCFFSKHKFFIIYLFIYFYLFFKLFKMQQHTCDFFQSLLVSHSYKPHGSGLSTRGFLLFFLFFFSKKNHTCDFNSGWHTQLIFILVFHNTPQLLVFHNTPQLV